VIQRVLELSHPVQREKAEHRINCLKRPRELLFGFPMKRLKGNGELATYPTSWATGEELAAAQGWRTSMKKKDTASATNIYLLFAASLLLRTPLAKLWSAAGEARILAVRDPLLLRTNRELLIGVGLLELAVTAYLIFGRNTLQKHLLIVWLSVNFTVYRLGIGWVAPGRPCPCLGTLTARLPLKPDTVDLLLKLVIVYMLCGSIFFPLLAWVRDRGEPRAGAMEDAVVKG
jgi:hypothetical protein